MQGGECRKNGYASGVKGSEEAQEPEIPKKRCEKRGKQTEKNRGKRK